MKSIKTIVIIPAINEEKTIAGVISEFHREVHDADKQESLSVRQVSRSVRTKS
jgi:hypothetical protein